MMEKYIYSVTMFSQQILNMYSRSVFADIHFFTFHLFNGILQMILHAWFYSSWTKVDRYTVKAGEFEGQLLSRIIYSVRCRYSEMTPPPGTITPLKEMRETLCHAIFQK